MPEAPDTRSAPWQDEDRTARIAAAPERNPHVSPDSAAPPVTVTTLGHGHRSHAELLALLAAGGVRLLVDVRRYPASRRQPHMNKATLAAALAEAGVEYRHAEDLGGYRTPRVDSPHDGLPDEALRGYADHMRTAAFRRALEHLLLLAAQAPTAILCAETSPQHCHRALLSDALLVRGARVLHLLAADHVEAHALHPCARVEPDGHLLYRAADAGQLDLFTTPTSPG